LAFGLTRAQLAERAGIAPDTLKRFEQRGQISLERLLKVAFALDALAEFSTLFPEPRAATLAELENQSATRARKRGPRTSKRPESSSRDVGPLVRTRPPQPQSRAKT
jgi:transcriptional regulator with XRE-family HTH domain